MYLTIGIYLAFLAVCGILTVTGYSSRRETGAATTAAIFVVVDALFAAFLLVHR